MRKLFFFALLLLSSYGFIYAQGISQIVVANSGERISGANGSLSFTMGEPIVGTIDNGSSLEQGFWHVSLVVIVLNDEDFSLESTTTVYPNPVSDQLTLSFPNLENKEYEFKIFDTTGKLVYNEQVSLLSLESHISFENLSSGSYLLQVKRVSDSQSKTFKILKL